MLGHGHSPDICPSNRSDVIDYFIQSQLKEPILQAYTQVN